MTRRKTISAEMLLYGKVPPQAKDLEEAVLGAIMVEAWAFGKAVDILKPECFYVEGHQRIFKAMSNLAKKSQPIDILTVTEELRKGEELDSVGGPYYVTKLTNSVASSANIVFHSRIIFDRWQKRELIRLGGELVGKAYEDSTDVQDLIEEHEKEFTALSINKSHTDGTPLDASMIERFQRIVELKKSDKSITGITSGFMEIDRLTHGWQDTDLIILAARPAVGKTALALNLAVNASKSNISVDFYSLEMSTGQLTDRILSAESEIWLEKLKNGQMEDYELKQLYEKGLQKLASLNLNIDDTPALNVHELRAKIRRSKVKRNTGLVIIDYLQLMRGTGEYRGNREREIAEISSSLKSLAKELKIPIIALSQLSREPEKRKGDNRMPQLSDLRESGAIEQDADVVMFMYRPEYYGENANEMGESTSGETHLRIAKHRNGSLAVIKLKAMLHIQKFSPWDPLEDVKPLLGTGNWKPVRKEEQPF